MEKRPSGIYLIISIWLGLGLLTTFSRWSRFSRENELFGAQSTAIAAILGLIIIFFAIWEIRGLFHLRKPQRWIAIIYFSIWSLNAALNLLSLSINNALTGKKLMIYIFVFVANGAAIYFLTRPKFIISQEQFNKELDAVKLQESISSKNQAPNTKLQRNLKWIIAIAVSLLVLIIYQSLFMSK